jgi:hypothetical protein
MGQLGKVGGNLNQLAHNLNLVAGSVSAEEIRAALADLRQLRAATLAAIQGGNTCP